MRQNYAFMALSGIRQAADDFLSLFFPRLCAACNGNLVRGEEAVCTACLDKMPRTNDALSPAENPVARVFWGRIPLQGAAACFIFSKGSHVQELIHNLKYNGRTDAGIAAGKLFGAELKDLTPFNTATAIVPVPLHRKKLLKRGYNQSASFGEGLASAMGIPHYPDGMLRLDATESQTKKSRNDRWDNVAEVFAVNPKAGLKGKHIILVDDVITTGATIEACVNPLLALEGTTVSVIALANARG